MRCSNAKADGKKGFPGSYDLPALLRFLTDVKPDAIRRGADLFPPCVRRDAKPVGRGRSAGHSHRRRTQRSADGTFAERWAGYPFVSDFFDFSVYIDADEDVLLGWYVHRFLTLRGTAFRDPKSYFHRYSGLSDEEATKTATSIWSRINLINLHENILPTRQRADLILKKQASHQVQDVALRRL